MPPLPGDPGDQDKTIGPPPPTAWGMQAAQLVVIPAAIVLVCIGLAVLFGKLAGAPENINNHLLKLRQSSGMGKMPLGMQDPRYKDRWLAAYNVATMIRDIKNPQERAHISHELVQVLNHHVAENEQTLEAYLLLALGQLGQDGGLEAIIERLNKPHAKVQQAAIGAVLSWPNQQAARQALPAMVELLHHEQPAVRALAAAALGELANPNDTQVIQALRQAMDSMGTSMREARWNAAVALARLGDPHGSQLVAGLLLNRQALAQLPAAESGQGAQKKMPGPMQDRIMLSTLSAADTMKGSMIWDKINDIADNDASQLVRNAAKAKIGGRK